MLYPLSVLSSGNRMVTTDTTTEAETGLDSEWLPEDRSSGLSKAPGMATRL